MDAVLPHLFDASSVLFRCTAWATSRGKFGDRAPDGCRTLWYYPTQNYPVGPVVHLPSAVAPHYAGHHAAHVVHIVRQRPDGGSNTSQERALLATECSRTKNPSEPTPEVEPQVGPTRALKLET
jgi:hypothetical protein